MSDELRDLLRARADAIDVPTGDFSTVVRGGRGIKARRYAIATVAGVVAVATVAWGVTDGFSILQGDGPSDVARPAPSESAAAEATCGFVPFRPGYLPEGWSYRLQAGSGGQRGIPFKDQVPKALGHYFYAGPPRPVPGYFDVYETADYYQLGATGGEPIEVMGDEARIGSVEDGYSVELTYKGCDYSVMAFGPSLEELRKVATNLVPRNTCGGRETRPLDPLPDGRHFGSITGTDGINIDFDEAEFLTGDAAIAAARQDGVIAPGETVPNDYYIDDDDASVRGLPVGGHVSVHLETAGRDGRPGLSRFDFNDFVCMFGSDIPEDRANVQGPFWIDVVDGEVARIEQQYLP